jgi:hypothetical protein
MSLSSNPVPESEGVFGGDRELKRRGEERGRELATKSGPECGGEDGEW